MVVAAAGIAAAAATPVTAEQSHVFNGHFFFPQARSPCKEAGPFFEAGPRVPGDGEHSQAAEPGWWGSIERSSGLKLCAGTMPGADCKTIPYSGAPPNSSLKINFPPASHTRT